jgi:hypothetical protein
MQETAPDPRRWWALGMKRPPLAFVALCLAVALVSWAPSATASANLDLDARPNASSLTVPGDTFFPESIAATPAGTLFVESVVTGEILRFLPRSTIAETFVPAGRQTPGRWACSPTWSGACCGPLPST